MAFGSRTGIRGDGEDQGDATRVLTVSLSQPRPSIGPGPTTACEPTSPSVETPSVSPYPGKALWHEGQGQGQEGMHPQIRKKGKRRPHPRWKLCCGEGCTDSPHCYPLLLDGHLPSLPPSIPVLVGRAWQVTAQTGQAKRTAGT